MNQKKIFKENSTPLINFTYLIKFLVLFNFLKKPLNFDIEVEARVTDDCFLTVHKNFLKRMGLSVMKHRKKILYNLAIRLIECTNCMRLFGLHRSDRLIS